VRILALVSDAFGGLGGIAQFNRNLLGALCAYPGVTEVVAVTRRVPLSLEPLPPKLTYVTSGINSKLRYLLAVLRCLVTPGKYELICCGHLFLLPLAYLAKWKTRAPLVVFIHGLDAWQPPRSVLAARVAAKVDAVISVSELTTARFLVWARLPRDRVFLLPNAVARQHYGVGGKNPDLVQRYGLAGKTVLLTVSRLWATDNYKGIDEVLGLMPALAAEVPQIAYLIVGDGDDRERLQAKARSLGVADRVVFAGFIPEKEKPDHYRLADAYVMPGWGEGFGIVYLEAMACGIPVLGSKLDGSREALRDGALGILVDPHDRDELRWGILEVLNRPRGLIPPGLSYVSLENFTRRCHEIVRRIMEKG
jgi:glycosyltransferase involved in cell wall biosynthesis